MRARTRISILALTALCLSCGGATKASSSGPPAADVPAHAVHSRQLRKIMRHMRSLTFSRMPQELGDGNRLSPERASSIASQLAAAADEIVMAAPELGLTADERDAFIVEADALRGRALDLEQGAATGDARAVDTAFSAIENSCSHCHSLFREAATR